MTPHSLREEKQKEKRNNTKTETSEGGSVAKRRPEFKYHPDRYLDLLTVVPNSSPWPSL